MGRRQLSKAITTCIFTTPEAAGLHVHDAKYSDSANMPQTDGQRRGRPSRAGPLAPSPFSRPLAPPKAPPHWRRRSRRSSLTSSSKTCSLRRRPQRASLDIAAQRDRQARPILNAAQERVPSLWQITALHRITGERPRRVSQKLPLRSLVATLASHPQCIAVPPRPRRRHQGLVREPDVAQDHRLQFRPDTPSRAGPRTDSGGRVPSSPWRRLPA